MPASDFRKARESGENVIIDGYPYHPNHKVTADDEDSVKTAVFSLLKANGYETSDASAHLRFSRVSGGTTNQLVRVSNIPTKELDSVLVRIFGAEGMIDRDEETDSYRRLADEGVAPPYFGRFANGRLEGWLHNMRALQTEELINTTESVARQLALLHAGIDIPKGSQTTMWKQLEDWYQQACESSFKTSHDTQRAKKSLGLEKIRSEIDWLTSEAPNETESPVAFCHNDLLAANIMVHVNDMTKIQLIDFEYGGINFVAFDIANHFNEFAGGPPDKTEPDYSKLPPLQQQREFCQIYLRERPLEELAVEELLKHVQVFILINHLYWGLWGVNQAAMEGTQEFDYMLYAISRFQEYYVAKDAYSVLNVS